jgi:hypothetical protein
MVSNVRKGLNSSPYSSRAECGRSLEAELREQAIQEATGAPVKERLRGLKKKDLAAEVAKFVSGTGWLPELLRK